MQNEEKPKIIKNKIDKIKLQELTLQAVFDAYYDCRKRKRNTMQSMKFEWQQEKKSVSAISGIKRRHI